MTITHTFTSPKADGADATLVRPSNWNDTHTIAAGYEFIRKATVTLTDAQILALPTTPIEIVPTPGADKNLMLIAAYIKTHIVVPYANLDTNPRYIQIFDNDGDAMSIPTSYSDTYALLTTDNSRTILTPTTLWNKNIDGTNYNTPNSFHTFDNQPLLLTCVNTDGDFTDGDPANTLKITVLYYVIDL